MGGHHMLCHLILKITNHALKSAVYNNFFQQAEAGGGVNFIQEDLESHTHPHHIATPT